MIACKWGQYAVTALAVGAHDFAAVGNPDAGHASLARIE
jgi:hypothetical protein